MLLKFNMGEDRILIVKNKNNKLTAKVKRKANRSFSPDDYIKILNPVDPNDLALLFEDLQLLLNAPIDKAFRKFKERKQGGNPFF